VELNVLVRFVISHAPLLRHKSSETNVLPEGWAIKAFHVVHTFDAARQSTA
jgi:hypothetical protein